MRIVLETHRYAPELNKAYIGPNAVMYPAPGIKTIKQVRVELFPRLKKTGRYTVIKAINPLEFSRYDRQVQGFGESVKSIQIALRAMRQRHNIEGCKFEVKTRIIG